MDVERETHTHTYLQQTYTHAEVWRGGIVGFTLQIIWPETVQGARVSSPCWSASSCTLACDVTATVRRSVKCQLSPSTSSSSAPPHSRQRESCLRGGNSDKRRRHFPIEGVSLSQRKCVLLSCGQKMSRNYIAGGVTVSLRLVGLST